MKNNLFLIFFLFLSSFILGQTSGNPHVSNQVIISFSDNSSQFDRTNIINALGSLLQNSNVTNPSLIGKEVLVYVPNYPVTVDNYTYATEVELISSLNGQHANVDHADLNYIITAEQYTFDTYMGNYNMTDFSPIPVACEATYPGGKLEGTNVPKSTTIKVGILDTGLDPYYPTINHYVAGEVNVLADDNASENSIIISLGYDPSHPITPDYNGHGTAVAGIIAGLSSRVDLTKVELELYIIKCFDGSGSGNLFNMIQGIRAAGLLNLDMISLSWSYSPSVEDENAEILEEMLRAFSNDYNKIIVAGAGNKGSDLDDLSLAPAGLPNINNLITVAGTVGEESGCDGSLASFSNYGTPVEIAAPSASISVPGLNGYWTQNTSGTSFATPIVTAAVIQSWMSNVELIEGGSLEGNTIHPIVELVINSATTTPGAVGSNSGTQVVNFQEACGNSENNGGLFGLRAETNDQGTRRTNKHDLASGFQVAPNPFTDRLSITFDSVGEYPALVEIITLQGASIQKKKITPSGGSTINLELPTGLAVGPYLVKLSQNGDSYIKMIIKD